MPAKTYRPMFTKLPESRQARWLLVKEFIDAWHAPLAAADGFSEDEIREAEASLEFRLPAALREWLALAGKRKDVWSNQDSLYAPRDIVGVRQNQHPFYRKFDGTLVFYGENQGCEHWVIRDSDVNHDDPPVYRITDDPRQVSPTISAFAIQTLFREVIWRAPVFGWGGDFPPNLVSATQKQFITCDLPALFWSPLEPIRFFEEDDIVLVTHGDAWIYVAALNDAACARLPRDVITAMEWQDTR